MSVEVGAILNRILCRIALFVHAHGASTTQSISTNAVTAIDMLESLCGELFPKVFPIFLCDRGSEFSDP